MNQLAGLQNTSEVMVIIIMATKDLILCLWPTLTLD